MPAILLTLCFWGFLRGALCLALCGSRLRGAGRQLGWAALACGLHACLLLLPPLPFLVAWLRAPQPVRWLGYFQPENWYGLGADLLVSLAWVYGRPRLTPAAAGFCWPRWRALRVAGPVVLAVACFLFVSAYLERHAVLPLSKSQLLFYATMPGLVEEVFYRGILLGLLTPVFARTLPLFGTRTSWGGLVGVVLFMVGHNLIFPARLFTLGTGADFWRYVCAWLSPAHFPPGAVLSQLGLGTLFLWVRERTGSCWPAVAAHCLLNGCIGLGHRLP